jgi:TRAP transporter 4TM/12TM fusion protein
MTSQPVATATTAVKPAAKGESGLGMGRFKSLPSWSRWTVLAFTAATVGLFIYFNLEEFPFSIDVPVLEPIKYYYLLYVMAMVPIFMLFPMRKADKKKLPWYDILLGLLGMGISIYFLTNADTIAAAGWQTPPNTTVLIAAILVFVLSIEAGRRVGGLVFLIICLVFGAYPLYSQWMPGPLYGVPMSFDKLMGQFAFSTNGILGLPAEVNGNIVIGYLIFSGVMVSSGAGNFFLDLAIGLMGRFRGGPAKVSVVASALFGSLSASAVANVVAIGSVTIPAMKKLGYPPHYAGAIEACASTGDALTPPVMGTIAFVMAILTGVSYAEIAVAAALPAVLFFFGLLIQVDGYAARTGLVGMPKAEIPPLKGTLKKGWVFILAFVFLVWVLMSLGWTAEGPIIASVILIGLSWTNRDLRIGGKKLMETFGAVGTLIAWMIAILLPVGLIVAGLTVTGTAANIISQVVNLGQSNSFLILVVTAVACYLLGMIGLALLPYIFLAVTMAPIVVKAGGLDLIGVHLFLVYMVSLSGITPPVAMLAFVGAAVAGAPPMKTGWTAMRLGIVLFFIPFFFVYSPTLLMKGDVLLIIKDLLLALIGIWILTSGLEGYMLKVGTMPWWARVTMFIGGFLFAIPLSSMVNVSVWLSPVIGAGITLLTLTILLIYRKSRAEPLFAKGL